MKTVNYLNIAIDTLNNIHVREEIKSSVILAKYHLNQVIKYMQLLDNYMICSKCTEVIPKKSRIKYCSYYKGGRAEGPTDS